MGTDPRLPGLTTDDGASRRAFLTKVAIGGAALTVGSQLVPATRLFPTSGAQEEEGETELDGIDTQTRFLASLSLAAAEAYRTAATTSSLPEPMIEVVRAFGAQHHDQAAALVTLLPEEITIETIPPNPSVLAETKTAIEGAGDPPAVLGALRSLEEAITATQADAIGTVTSDGYVSLIATLTPICAQHSTVLGALAGQGPTDLLPDSQDTEQDIEAALRVAEHPVGEVEAEGDAPSGSTTTESQGGEGAEPGDEGDAGETGDGTESSGGGASDGSGDSAGTEG